MMKHGFVFTRSDPRAIAEAAREAERAGWDGFFIADLVWGMDAWVSLAAAAVRTSCIRLGTMLTPLAWTRPWKLASETAALDHLSNGRVILSVGLGANDTGVANFGLPTERKLKAELVDVRYCGRGRDSGQRAAQGGGHHPRLGRGRGNVVDRVAVEQEREGHDPAARTRPAG
jgi:hypothetical protein